jgi:predicted AAA+ superfamily ATPase
VLVHPFSFREVLRHRGVEPSGAYELLDAAGRSQLDADLRAYLHHGGFPEAQALPARERHLLLAQYVDVVVLRDVIERHALSNPLALQWLRRELLATPAGNFTVQKLWGAMRSQGISVGKDTVHAMLAQLEDAFLLRTAWRYSASERQRMVSPRKVYPVDPALIPLFERSGRPQIGRALETVVALELERRGHTLHYALTPAGFEIDFVATQPGAAPVLVQVSASALDPRTRDRELRALHDGMSEHPTAGALFLTLDATPPPALPAGVRWMPAARWLLEL